MIIALISCSSVLLADDNIIEYKDEKSPVTFKYDKREYRVAPSRGGPDMTSYIFEVVPMNYGKKESICTDKKYNKHFCPRLRIVTGVIKIDFDSIIQKTTKMEILEWKENIKRSVVVLPEVVSGNILKQEKKSFSCDKNSESGFSMSQTFADKDLGLIYYVHVHDAIFTSPRFVDEPRESSQYIETSKFFEKNYCDDNEALKNWDIGNHARMVLESVKPNLDFFKHNIEKKKAEEELRKKKLNP